MDLAELASERREILPLEAFPPKLLQSFVAIEDRRFYEHSGLDYRGMLRALVANLRAGHVVQGGSTITQQVARSFLRTSEQTLQRKIREAILARRLEARYEKNQILALYLNQIFLGHQSYGVAAAARRYFNKQVSELDLGEMATIAGIVQAPSRYSPLLAPDLTRARRDQVLGAMAIAQVIDEATANNLRARPLAVRQPPDVFRERSPYFAEHVRRDIAKRYGEKALWEGGLDIETALVPWIDEAAQENVDFSLRKLDKRQGWRGPVAHLAGTMADEFRRRASARYGASSPIEGRLYLGLVESTGGGKAQVRVGEKVYPLPSAGMEWAAPYSTVDSTNGRTLTSTNSVLHPGDVVWVTPMNRSRLRRFSDWTYDNAGEVQWMPAYAERKAPTGPVTLRLEQTPKVQGSLYSYDHQTGYVVAMVGGLDFDRSEFNRVVQACRQPGSTYKPVYYSLALDRGYGYASLLNDTPRAEVDPITGEVWIPQNLNNTVEYQVNLEYALVWSKNVPSVQLFKLVGGKDVEAWARRLGITTPIIPDQALALGASCTRIDELTRAFSAFARNGSLSEPIYVRRVRDRAGQVLEDNTAVSDPMNAPDLRLDRMVALAGKRSKDVIPPRTAWLTSQLMRHVVTKGHAPSLRSSGLFVGGKTGTSSATMDTWFVGYTSRWMTTSWIGDDRRERPLGFKDAAFMLSVPMTARYLYEVTAGQPLKDIP
jgi:penicillin-binding protein 1A